MRTKVAVDFRVTTRDLMETKDCYDVMNSERAIQLMFEQAHANKNFVKILSSDPDPLNSDVVLLKIEAELL